MNPFTDTATNQTADTIIDLTAIEENPFALTEAELARDVGTAYDHRILTAVDEETAERLLAAMNEVLVILSGQTPKGGGDRKPLDEADAARMVAGLITDRNNHGDISSGTGAVHICRDFAAAVAAEIASRPYGRAD